MPRRDPRLLRYARQMRRYPTNGEAILWLRLRSRQLGVRFRRQEPIGPYIADFACRSRPTTVEVDGDTHIDIARDDERDRWFVEHGWQVLRFWDDDVIEATDQVVEIIKSAIEDPSSFPNPFRWNP